MVAEHVEKMQQRSAELNDKLGFGAYAWKQLRSLSISLIAIGGGGFLGHAIGKGMKNSTMQVPKFLQKFINTETVSSRFGAMGIGIVAGTLVDGLFQGYEHWAKGEAARLGVDEMNRDIAESRLCMNPELLRENALLREMVAKQEEQLKTARHEPIHHKPHHEKPEHMVSMKDAHHEPSAHAQGEQMEAGLA